MCKVPTPCALVHRCTITDVGLGTACRQPVGWSLFSLARQMQILWFLKRISNRDVSNHRTDFHFTSIHPKWAGLKAGSSVSGSGCLCSFFPCKLSESRLLIMQLYVSAQRSKLFRVLGLVLRVPVPTHSLILLCYWYYMPWMMKLWFLFLISHWKMLFSCWII